jgi:hypothetical protein
MPLDAGATLVPVLEFLLRRIFRRRPAEPDLPPGTTVSRGGEIARGMRSGDQRHRPTKADKDLAEKLGTKAYDPEKGQL